MTSRGKADSFSDWDPKKDGSNSTTYNAHYQDHDFRGRSSIMPLNYKKLYITNLPKGLSVQGLKAAFDKFGVVEQTYINSDPNKKYAIVRYETESEARVAMMKMNKTEPLNMNVNFAHAQTVGQKNNEAWLTNESRDRGQRDSGSFVSNSTERRCRNPDGQATEEVELEAAMPIDRDFHLEMEQLKLEKLRIQEEQLKCKQKMMLLQMDSRQISNSATGASSRLILPDGRIVVKNKAQEPDVGFIAGAGDSSVAQPACVVCGAFADLFCSRCHVTPYCSPKCQLRDWTSRHRAVCHNLMRLQPTSSPQVVEPIQNNETELPSPLAPLRRPRSPVSTRIQPQRDRAPPANLNNKTRFVPPDHHPQPGCNNSRDNSQDHRPQQNQNNSHDDVDWAKGFGSPAKRNNNNQYGHRQEQQPRNNDHRNENRQNTRKKVEQKAKPQAAEPKLQATGPKPAAPAPTNMVVKDSPRNTTVAANLPLPKTPDRPLAAPPEAVPLVPSHYMVEKLPIGETFGMILESLAEDCATSQPGFVGWALHNDYKDQYNLLLEDIFQNELPVTPAPGDIFAYCDPADQGWYRARCVAPSRAVLLDAARAVPLAPAGPAAPATAPAPAPARALADKYRTIPEFSCVLNGNVEIGMSLNCTILMKTADGYKVSIQNNIQDEYLGEATVTRWMPEIEYGPTGTTEWWRPVSTAQPIQEKTQPIKVESRPEKAPVADRLRQELTQEAVKTPVEAPAAPPASQNAAQQIPAVPRPALAGGAAHYLLHAASLARACVRPAAGAAAAEFGAVLQDTAQHGMRAVEPLKEPPPPGRLVLSLFEGAHYRALVKRTKAADNRYMIEYVEYGNEEIVPLENLFECPAKLDLSSRPTQASLVVLSNISSKELTDPAIEYLETLKEQVELIATIPGGGKTAPSGSLVHLALAKNNESINRKLEEMCKPKWKKLEEKGKDVMESDVLLYEAIETLQLPTDRAFVLDVTDFGNLQTGLLGGFDHAAAHRAEQVLGPLTDKINEYCNSDLCKEFYLPVVEELCLARLPPYPQWFRAVVIEHHAGQPTAAVLYIDYGNVESAVPVADLRKIMPEFCTLPALAATAEVKHWPKPPSEEQLLRAIEYLKINEEGRGQLRVKRAKKLADDLGYVVEVPELIAAINAV